MYMYLDFPCGIVTGCENISLTKSYNYMCQTGMNGPINKETLLEPLIITRCNERANKETNTNKNLSKTKQNQIMVISISTTPLS